MLFTILLACGQPEPEYTPVQRPPLVIEGKVLRENLPEPGKEELYIIDNCHSFADHMFEALGYPESPDGPVYHWTKYEPVKHSLSIAPGQEPQSCEVRVYTWD
jgi:hypothetical protein